MALKDKRIKITQKRQMKYHFESDSRKGFFVTPWFRRDDQAPSFRLILLWPCWSQAGAGSSLLNWILAPWRDFWQLPAHSQWWSQKQEGSQLDLNPGCFCLFFSDGLIRISSSSLSFQSTAWEWLNSPSTFQEAPLLVPPMNVFLALSASNAKQQNMPRYCIFPPMSTQSTD